MLNGVGPSIRAGSLVQMTTTSTDADCRGSAARQVSVPAGAALCLCLLAALQVRTEEAAAPEPEPASTLLGQWGPRAKLEAAGVAPFAQWTTEGWGNAAGGLARRGWWNSLLDFGFELDMEKLGWWQGGHFMAQVYWVSNSHREGCFDDYAGGVNPVSGIMAGDQLRVFNLHYRQVWGEETTVLKLGQLAVDDDFMGSDYAGLFLNSAFGAMPSQVGTPLATSCGNPPAFPIYAVAAPGAFLSTRFTDSLTSQLGLYYGRPGFDEPGNHGFDWVSQEPAELGVFWETACAYRVAQRPATTRLGLSYHTGPLDDFSGQWADEPPATRQNVPNFYLIHDLQLLADAQGAPKLGLFARGGVTPQPDRSMVGWYADAGLNWFAPLPGRAEDVAGVAASHTQFGHDYRASTGPDGIAAGETTLELTYRAQVTRWMALQADVQFLFNPAVDPESGRRETATILGLRAELSF